MTNIVNPEVVIQGYYLLVVKVVAIIYLHIKKMGQGTSKEYMWIEL